MERTVDVALIGAGSAGLYALAKVRRATKSFVLINGGDLGTTCARVGCMPSKVAIQVAKDFHSRHRLERYGVTGWDALEVDPSEAMEHVRDLRDIFVDRVISGSTDQMDEEFIQGYAEFVEPNVLKVGGRVIRAKKIILATGSRPYVPSAWKAFGDRVLTTDTLFEQEDLPPSIAVLGLGIIGVEMGQSLHRLGLNVTGIDKLTAIGGLQDPEVNKVAIETLGREFPMWLGYPATVERENGKLRVSAREHSVQVDKILASLGRVPNLDGMGIDKLGVELDERGVPKFNPHTMQVGDLPVFIAGDVTGDKAILHEAGDEGRIAGYNAVHNELVAFSRRVSLAITFTDPNIATVGTPWSELDQDQLATGEVRFGSVGRAIIIGKNRGLLRIYGDRSSGRILGASMIAPEGEHLAHLLALSIQQRLTVFDLLKMPFYHPVMEEALQAALYDLTKQVEASTDAMLELARV
jgi:dihydrolipoamide dehydrogenase